ncbi:MAG: hypothetical protein KF873_23420 [Gemmataceae bacterium]|nr:hypothetical protein [Planctomycetia bacterium]MBX3401690.1 hypothetical protein [Gemmataceae bacterium]
MTQPTFSEGPPVPLMVEGTIDSPTLAKMFAEIESHGTLIGIREKAGPGDYAGTEELTPALALDRLQRREARAVQIRYRHDGFEWTDTVLAMPDGFRVVRCRHG